VTTATINADPVGVNPPDPQIPSAPAGADLAGVISFVQDQLRILGDLCAEPSQPHPPGLTPEELQRQRETLARAARTLADREAMLQAWHERLVALQNRLATEHEAVAGTLEQRRAHLNSLDGSLRARDSQTASRRESLAAREASLTAAEGELAERERRFASARQSLDRRSAELDAAGARLEERAARLAERAESVRAAETQADARATVITQQQSTLDERHHEAAEREARAAEVVTLRATVASLQVRLQEAESRAPQPEASSDAGEIERISRQRDALARELSDRERLVEQLSADCLVLRADADAALSRAAEQDRQVRRLEGRIAESAAEASGQTGQIETQRALLRAAQTEAVATQHRLEEFRSELDLRHQEVTDRAHELDLREVNLERRQAALEASTGSTGGAKMRPAVPGVTAVPSEGMVVPAAWFDWEAPRRCRSFPDRSVPPSARR
jgi:chromosome segregation ATPase